MYLTRTTKQNYIIRRRKHPKEIEQHTREAASSTLEEIYRVTTIFSPSVTQKFMRLGCKGSNVTSWIVTRNRKKVPQ
jgi:hypothetical protein